MRIVERSQNTLDWDLYQKGRAYNTQIKLDETVSTNIRFYEGDQWKGVNANGLPTPVFNIFKRIINYFISAIMAQKTTFSYTPELLPSVLKDNSFQKLKGISENLTDYARLRWEKLKMDSKLNDALLDAALSGDAIFYTYWDERINNGEEYKGDFVTDLVDNINVFFGNPNNKDVQSQPFIIISGRELVSTLQSEARAENAPEAEILKITADEDNLLQAGDLGKIEMDGTKATFIIKFFKDENGNVVFRKSTRNVVIRQEVYTGLKKYPISVMNWDRQKNSWHGRAVASGLVDNQTYINKAFAMVMRHMMDTAFSKVIYDTDVIEQWDNTVGAAIGVTGLDNRNINQIASVISPGTMQGGVLSTIEMAVSMTKDMMGATDAALGNVKPENTSAIIAVQQAAAIPLETIKRNLYQFVEDTALIWLDFMRAYYGNERILVIEKPSTSSMCWAGVDLLSKAIFSCNVDVGATSYWSEIASINTLDNLLASNHITFKQYLDRIPDGIIPEKQGLIEEIGVGNIVGGVGL